MIIFYILAIILVILFLPIPVKFKASYIDNVLKIVLLNDIGSGFLNNSTVDFFK